MKWLSFLYKSMMSNRRRSLLTMGAVATALFMYISLQTVNNALKVKIETGDKETRLAVMDMSGDFHNPLPLSYLSQFSRVEHIDAVSPVCLTALSPGADEGKIFLSLAVEPEAFRTVYRQPLENLPAGQYAKFAATRNGVIVGRSIIERTGWRLGDIVRLKSPSDKFETDFEICAIYANLNGADKQMESQIFLQYPYFDEIKGRKGRVNFFWVAVDSKRNEHKVIQGIAREFADAPTEVTVETQSAMLNRMNQLTETMRQVVGVISAMVMGTVLLVILNAIALSMRERTREIAVMKAIGFTPGRVLTLVLSESVLLSLLAGLAGTLAAYALFASAKFSVTTILTFNFAVTPISIVQGFAISLALGVLGGLLPAVQASRVKVISALRSL